MLLISLVHQTYQRGIAHVDIALQVPLVDKKVFFIPLAGLLCVVGKRAVGQHQFAVVFPKQPFQAFTLGVFLLCYALIKLVEQRLRQGQRPALVPKIAFAVHLVQLPNTILFGNQEIVALRRRCGLALFLRKSSFSLPEQSQTVFVQLDAYGQQLVVLAMVAEARLPQSSVHHEAYLVYLALHLPVFFLRLRRELDVAGVIQQVGAVLGGHDIAIAGVVPFAVGVAPLFLGQLLIPFKDIEEHAARVIQPILLQALPAESVADISGIHTVMIGAPCLLHAVPALPVVGQDEGDADVRELYRLLVHRHLDFHRYFHLDDGLFGKGQRAQAEAGTHEGYHGGGRRPASGSVREARLFLSRFLRLPDQAVVYIADAVG